MISSDFSNLLMFCDAMGMILVDLIPIFSINSITKHQKHTTAMTQKQVESKYFYFLGSIQFLKQLNLKQKETFSLGSKLVTG